MLVQYEFSHVQDDSRKNRQMRESNSGMNLYTAASQVMANVDSHQLALRSEILTIMSTFSTEDISGREGKQKLADSLKNGINDVLMKVEGFGGVENVHFTSFVLQ